MTQMPLDFGVQASYRHEDFVVTGCNRVAYEWIMRWPDWPAQVLWLCGPKSSGKTHLLHVWAQRSGAAIAQNNHLWIEPEAVFAGFNALAIDSLPSPLDEEALFHLLNHTTHQRKWLLITHESPPSRLSITLPDLKSRLNALPVAMLESPDDVLLHALLLKQLADRQLQVDADVIHYVLSRIERSCDAVASLVAHMDATSMQQKRRITLPFVRELLTSAST